MDLLGRDIYNETDFFKEQVYWVIYSTTPAVTYHTLFNDSYYQMQTYADDEQWTQGGMIYARNYYQDFMNFASNYWSSINVGKDARQWYNTIMAGNGTKAVDNFILAQDLNPSVRATSNLPLDFYASGMQYMYGRKAWDTSSTYFWWQMGNGGYGHEHKDTGNFHIWRGGRWLTRETPGYCDVITGYGYASNRIGNAACGCGDGGRTGEVSENMIVFGTPLGTDTILMPTVFTNSVVKRLESAAGYSYADVDMTNEYKWNGYAENERHAAVHVEREFLFLRNLETTVIFDRITTGNVTMGVDIGKAAADVVNTFLLHSEVNPTLEDATHITITNGTQVLRVTTLVPSSPTRRVIDEKSCTGCGHEVGQYRIELDTSGKAQRYFLNILQARASSDANITASVVDSAPGDPTTGTFTVTLHPATGSDTKIVFNKGQTSSGGTVSLTGAQALNLRAGVQTISYTDNGPVWLNATCGDGSCSGGETCSSCAADCGACPSCGDGACNGSETCVTCKTDCGGC